MTMIGRSEDNRYEDQRAEDMAERISLALEPLTILAREFAQHDGPDDAIVDRREDEVILAIMKLIDSAYSTGYSDGMADEQYAREANRE